MCSREIISNGIIYTLLDRSKYVFYSLEYSIDIFFMMNKSLFNNNNLLKNLKEKKKFIIIYAVSYRILP
jgi:hypothetical protein